MRQTQDKLHQPVGRQARFLALALLGTWRPCAFLGKKSIVSGLAGFSSKLLAHLSLAYAVNERQFFAFSYSAGIS